MSVRLRVGGAPRGDDGSLTRFGCAGPAGAHTEQLLDDVVEVQAFATGLQAQLGLAAAATVKPDTVHELCGRAQRVGLTYVQYLPY